MKIMTFNTQHCKNYVEGHVDFEIMAKAIKSCAPDIVGLNEMFEASENPDLEKQVEKLCECAGMKYCYFAKAVDLKRGTYGNGFLSNIPILNAESIAIPDPAPRGYNGYYETRCVLKAELEGGFTVLVSHFGLNPDEAENAVRTVMASLADEKCILMGDFNMKPEDPILAPIFKAMKDTAEVFDGERLSFPSDKPDRKIDYIFVSSDAKIIEADIPAIVASDHRPHTATVEF